MAWAAEADGSKMKSFFAERTILRWFSYALTFGLLWGVFADALTFGDSASTAAVQGAVGGVLFATVALARERRGVFRRHRRP